MFFLHQIYAFVLPNVNKPQHILGFSNFADPPFPPDTSSDPNQESKEDAQLYIIHYFLKNQQLDDQ